MKPRFSEIYANTGRPSIAPEKLLRALLLQVLYSVRSERMLMEQLDYDLLFRWFVGLNMDDAIWDATVFTKNRQRRDVTCQQRDTLNGRTSGWAQRFSRGACFLHYSHGHSIMTILF